MTLPGVASSAFTRVRQLGCRGVLGDGFRRAEVVCATTQWMTRESFREWQWTRLTSILDAAYGSSPLYRRRLESAGWPNLTPETFRRIPPLTKNDVEQHALGIGRPSSVPGPRRASGGSNGSRIAIPLDRATYSWYLAGTWRGLGWWGVAPADRLVLLLGRSPGSPLSRLLTWAKDLVVNWRRIAVDHRFDQRAPEILARIEALGPQCLYGYPSAVHRLVRAIRTRGWRPRRRLGLVVLTGEPLYGFQRRAIAETLQCAVAEEYGAGELGCIAFECPNGALHVAGENVFLEILPDANGDRPIGRVLITHLRNQAFPLIRYDTGDAGIALPGPCRCGRGLPTLRVLGRAHDRLTSAQISVPARGRIEQFFSDLPERLHGSVRVAHTAAGRIVLQAERGALAGPAGAVVATVGQETFGPGWEVRMSEVEHFRRGPSGKLSYFVTRQ